MLQQLIRVNRFDQRIEQAVAKERSAPVRYEGLLNDKQVQWLREREQHCRLAKKNPGILNFKYDKGGVVEGFIESLMEPYLGKIVRHGGSFVSTSVPFHVHTDTGKTDEMGDQYFPYKNILIPLSASSESQQLSTIFFNQRNFGQASHFWRGERFEGQVPKYNFKVTDYQDLIGFTNEHFDQDDYEKYLTHLPYENLFGLSIDRIVEWSIGDVIVFDCSQLHASNNFSGSHTEKMSLTYFSSKEIQDELG
ncbi:MAG: hypothetical protein HRT45_03070 [Bdellovibrionales bacterium]|nr:hypothetical protein [Bdellovibrionales bacterium]